MPNAISFARVDNRASVTGVKTAITATTTAKATGAALTGAWNVVTSATSHTAVVLPASYPAMTPIVVHNTGTTTALVYPPTGGAINGGSADASINLASTKPAVFMVAEDGLTWIGVIGA